MGSQPWRADFEISLERAADLIKSQFPRFADSEIRPLSKGWDNAAFLAGGEFVFRFPRRNIAANLLQREARILPLLAPYLPAQIPTPEFVGAAGPEFPWVYTGYRRIPGETADRLPLTDEDRVCLAPLLARFLAALHRIPVDDDTRQWAPGDDLRRADVTFRAPTVLDRLDGVRGIVDSDHVDTAKQLIRTQIPSTQHPTPPKCWVHGDLYARHILLGERRSISGVIDWGDVHLGDPALDLSIAFSFLPARGRIRFQEEYGSVGDAGIWDRARFRAVHYAPILIEYGRATADSAMEEAGRTALRFALED